MSESITCGVHHVGLAVPDVGEAAAFFIGVLGWREVGRNDSYPAVFVSDGAMMVTLWRVTDPGSATPFDRRQNIGLHHLALAVTDEAALMAAFEKVSACPGVSVEFAPCPTRPGSDVKHFMCAMPGGIRVEFRPRA